MPRYAAAFWRNQSALLRTPKSRFCLNARAGGGVWICEGGNTLFPGGHHNETNTLRRCTAQHGDRGRKSAACAKSDSEIRPRGVGARPLEVEYCDHVDAAAGDHRCE